MIRTPFFLKLIYPSVICRLTSSEKKLYLTFDDGPIPGVTEEVINILKQHKAKATFFCVGANVVKHPYEFSLLQKEKHAIGNHTMHHLNGFKTSHNDYKEDVAKASNYISSKLFRPPYGRMKPAQYNALKSSYKIVMWDVLSCDFDANVTREQCLQNVTGYSRNGSIIVFHDSVKAADKMLYALPQVLNYFTERGYSFETIPQPN